MSEWQDIKTAPKDGTQVLLWADTWDMTWGVQMGYFCDAKHRWETYEGSVVENEEDFDWRPTSMMKTTSMPTRT